MITRDTVEQVMKYSLEAMMPVFGLSDKHVEAGAFMALSVDAYDMGRQAGEMANRILAGEDVKSIPVVHARKGELSVNLSTAEHCGITVPPDALKRAREIY